MSRICFVAAEGGGVRVGVASAGANRQVSKLLEPTLDSVKDQVGDIMPEDATIHLDSAYHGKACAQTLNEHGLTDEIAVKGVPAPIQVGKRWVVERTHSWMNGYGKLRRCFERTGEIVEFYLYLAAAFVTPRALIQRAPPPYPCNPQPTTPPLHYHPSPLPLTPPP